MQAENLTQENISDLKKEFEKMKKENPELEYRFYQQGERMEGKACDQCISQLKEQIETLNNKIDRIFGDYVLIDGGFRSL